jgi:hypothetical protein
VATGGRLPEVTATGAGAGGKNERVEVVFVTRN